MAKGSKVRVVMDPKGAAALLHSGQVADELKRRMRRVHAAAVATAPVDPREDGVHYRDSLRVEVDHAPSRVRARVVAGVPYGGKVEARHGTLARALDAAGGA